MEDASSGSISIGKPVNTRRRAVSVSTEALVDLSFLPSGSKIPLVIQPKVELDLVEWSRNNRSYIENLLAEHRALLFRNFNLGPKPEAAFAQFVKETSSGDMLEYRDRTTPRHEVEDRVYTSTDYPAENRIFLHNEGTYWLTWPMKLYLSCVISPDQGGETPIGDVRNVYNRIDPKIRDRFIEKKWMLVRNYNDGFGLSWQDVFQTKDQSVVDEYCRKNRIHAEWKGNDRLRTKQIRPAVATHPRTGEKVWFNHAAFFHVSSLEPGLREAFSSGIAEEDLPYNTYYGDGSRIEESVAAELREAYLAEKVAFRWQVGDVEILDNMSVAHARESFVGQRKVLVAMAEPYSRTDY